MCKACVGCKLPAAGLRGVLFWARTRRARRRCLDTWSVRSSAHKELIRSCVMHLRCIGATCGQPYENAAMHATAVQHGCTEARAEELRKQCKQSARGCAPVCASNQNACRCPLMQAPSGTATLACRCAGNKIIVKEGPTCTFPRAFFRSITAATR